MAMSLIMIVHVTAGTISVLSGMTALSVRKGSRAHRAAGNVFFGFTLIMAAAGAFIAYRIPIMAAFLAGVFTCYLVATSWMTIKPRPGKTGLFEFGALLVALGVAAGGLVFGFEAAGSDSGLKDGFPAFGYFFFGTLASLAAVLDARLLVRKGVAGGQRIARHLWRMCLALYLATGSLFTGPGAQAFPEWIQGSAVLSVPEITVVLLMLFWLVRIGLSNRYGKAFGFPRLPACGLRSNKKEELT